MIITYTGFTLYVAIYFIVKSKKLEAITLYSHNAGLEYLNDIQDLSNGETKNLIPHEINILYNILFTTVTLIPFMLSIEVFIGSCFYITCMNLLIDMYKKSPDLLSKYIIAGYCLIYAFNNYSIYFVPLIILNNILEYKTYLNNNYTL